MNYFLLIVFIASCAKSVDYYNIPLQSTTGNYNAVIEIPSGTNKKFE